MRKHTALFSIFLVVLFYKQIVVFEGEDLENTPSQNCKYLRAFEIADYLGVLINLAIVGLFTYMSTELSQPLTDYWQNFLLIY